MLCKAPRIFADIEGNFDKAAIQSFVKPLVTLYSNTYTLFCPFSLEIWMVLHKVPKQRRPHKASIYRRLHKAPGSLHLQRDVCKAIKEGFANSLNAHKGDFAKPLWRIFEVLSASWGLCKGPT